jgi:hypothetical protein
VVKTFLCAGIRTGTISSVVLVLTCILREILHIFVLTSTFYFGIIVVYANDVIMLDQNDAMNMINILHITVALF